MRTLLFLLLSWSFGVCAFAHDSPVNLPVLGGPAPLSSHHYSFSRPTAWDWMARMPDDLRIMGKTLVAPDNTSTLLGVAASTAFLIKYDQSILNASQRLAKRLGLIAPPATTGREYYYLYETQVQGVDLPVYVPANFNATLYYFGDGYTQSLIVGGFVGYGMYFNDNRALQTASLAVESLFTMGVVVQILKRTTGRESPFRATQPGGRWDLLPNQKAYNNNTPRYDAFPSGHLASVIASTTVIAANYPEYTWIKPLGYAATTLLGFSMLNNGVHWASDYPIAILLGYTSAKIALARLPITNFNEPTRTARVQWLVWPISDTNGGAISLHLSF